MSEIYFYSFLGLATFIISLVGTKLTIVGLRQQRLLIDIPNPRSNHRQPTPRGGGFAVVMAIVIGMSVADINYALLLSLLLLTAVSLLDDMIGLPPLPRLLVQIMAVTVAVHVFDKPIFGPLFPAWLDTLVAAFVWVWFTNIFNFMDGIDGLAAVETVSIGAALCLLIIFAGVAHDNLFAYSLVAAAAGCGFLWWNWHPAKIFLGDVGSIPIGFFLGYLLLAAVSQGYGHAAVLIPGYYLADSTLTLCRRLLKKKKIWVAHSEHYYQQAVRQGRSHDSVARIIGGMNILLAFMAIRSIIDPALAGWYVVFGYMSVFMLIGFFAHAPAKK